MTNHYLKIAAVLVLGIVIGALVHWLLSSSFSDLYVQTFSEIVPDDLARIQDGELIQYGSWELTSSDRDIPVVSTAISCRKAAMECSIANATVYQGGWFDNSLYHLKVTAWSQDGTILATVSGECATTDLSIDTVSNETTLTTTIVESATEERCGSLEPKTETWKLAPIPQSELSHWKVRTQDFFWSFDI